VPADERVHGVPGPVAAIVLKRLAKTAKTAEGVEGVEGVEAHGGRLWTMPQLPDGSMFRLILPALTNEGTIDSSS